MIVHKRHPNLFHDWLRTFYLTHLKRIHRLCRTMIIDKRLKRLHRHINCHIAFYEINMWTLQQYLKTRRWRWWRRRRRRIANLQFYSLQWHYIYIETNIVHYWNCNVDLCNGDAWGKIAYCLNFDSNFKNFPNFFSALRFFWQWNLSPFWSMMLVASIPYNDFVCPFD